MSAGLAGWAAHPVTLTLAGTALVTLFLVLEALLRGLGQLGNVRFQGVLDEHPNLLPLRSDGVLPLAAVLDVLRWLQVVAVGLLWVAASLLPGMTPVRAAVVGVGLPVASALLVGLLVGGVAERGAGVLLRLVRPLVWPVLALRVRQEAPVAPLAAEDEEDEASDREKQAYVEVGEKAGLFEPDESEMVHSLVEFFDIVVREVMTPRTDMVTVADTATCEELLERFAESRKSRIPVYRETVDRVVGVVHVKDLVAAQRDGTRPPVAELVRPCLVVLETKPLGDLLRDFQQNHQQLAIVVDEYGGTSGLVTLEDLLEQIVGDIRDEHEPTAPPEWQELEPGLFRLQGRASLEVLEDLFGLEVDEEDVDTVGGLVFSLHGTVPEPGTEVAAARLGLRFTVEEMQERRVVSVRVRREGETAAQPAGDGGRG